MLLLGDKTMKILNNKFLLTVGILICFSFLVLSVNFSSAQNLESSCEIDEEVARTAAEKILEHHKIGLMKREFLNGLIDSNSPTLFYDLNGRCAAYIFKVIDERNYYLGNINY